MHCHKILVIEDDDTIRESLVEMLASEGYKAVPAHHGKEALELLKDRKEDPCLILTDLMMPEMDGWEFIKLLREQDILITIPLVVMTASGVRNVPSARKVIKKPFDLPALVALVREHCGTPDGGPITKAQTFL